MASYIPDVPNLADEDYSDLVAQLHVAAQLRRKREFIQS